MIIDCNDSNQKIYLYPLFLIYNLKINLISIEMRPPRRNNFNNQCYIRRMRSSHRPYPQRNNQGRNFPNAFQNSAHAQQFNYPHSNVSQNNVNPQNIRNEEHEDNMRRIREVSMLPYLERRGLKALLSANPRFHLVSFKCVPKSIKTSLFLADMTMNLPEIKPKAIVSIHSNPNSTSSNHVDYMVGFNSVKIIKKLEEITGTGIIELYKSPMQIIIPNIENYNDCEYNKMVDDEINTSKLPFKLTHSETNTIKMVEMLEVVCGDKFHYVNSICCVGEVTYINISHSGLICTLTNAATAHNYKLESSDTITMTGTLPSSLMPIESDDLPVNASETGRMSIEEMIKFHGFKKIYENYINEIKNQELNLIKRSLRESQAVIQSSLYENEAKMDERIVPLELKITNCMSKIDEVTKKVDKSLEHLEGMEQRIVQSIINSMKPQNNAKSSSKALGPKTATTTRQQNKKTVVNPPICGITTDGNNKEEENWDAELEDEIDNTK